MANAVLKKHSMEVVTRRLVAPKKDRPTTRGRRSFFYMNTLRLGQQFAAIS
jgi:hypothetical protein